MKLRNPFTKETRLLFLYVYNCFDCGRSDRGLELHHIVGRESNSPLNAFPICTKCHPSSKHNKEEESKYLKKTLQFLTRQQYKHTKKDIGFYNKHYDKYN